MAKGTSSNIAQEKPISTKCSHCYTPAEKKSDLMVCSRCKAAKYCSRACQKAHWKTHKAFCDKNAAHAEALNSADHPLNILPSTLPDNISITELDARLEKWIHFHSPTLMHACIHALSLPRDITRAKSHILHLTLSPRPNSEHTTTTTLRSKFFRITTAEVVPVSLAKTWPEPWAESLVDLDKLREDGERKEYGTTAAVCVVCPPLCVQTVPFGSLRDLMGTMILPNWKSILLRDVEDGKKLNKAWITSSDGSWSPW